MHFFFTNTHLTQFKAGTRWTCHLHTDTIPLFTHIHIQTVICTRILCLNAKILKQTTIHTCIQTTMHTSTDPDCHMQTPTDCQTRAQSINMCVKILIQTAILTQKYAQILIDAHLNEHRYSHTHRYCHSHTNTPRYCHTHARIPCVTTLQSNT